MVPSSFSGYTAKDIRRFLAQHNIQPRRSAGQHFLIDRGVLKRIVQAADLQSADNVLEVGAGLGSLTVLLAEQVRKVWAVEIDQQLSVALRKLSTFYPQIDVIEADVRRLNIPELVGNLPYKVVANIPYNITSLLLRTLLTTPRQPLFVLLLVQKEVAERVLARPGDMSLLSLSVQLFSRPEILFPVSKRAFWPQPRVESAVVCLLPWPEPERTLLFHGLFPEEILRYARMGFASRRKTLLNNLQAGLRLPRERLKPVFSNISLSPLVRAQELSPIDWVKLVQGLDSMKIVFEHHEPGGKLID